MYFLSTTIFYCNHLIIVNSVYIHLNVIALRFEYQGLYSVVNEQAESR